MQCKLGCLLCTLYVLELNRCRHLLRVTINADNLSEVLEEGVNLDDFKLVMGDVLNVH